jgi:hypothetical protein
MDCFGTGNIGNGVDLQREFDYQKQGIEIYLINIILSRQ